MPVLQLAVLVTVVAGGVWAGVIVTFAVERTSIWARMPLKEFVVDFRRSVRRADPMQPILAVTTAAGALVLAVGAPGAAAGWAWAAFGLVSLVIVTTVTIAEPINSQFRRRPEGVAPPRADVLRRRWRSFHLARTVAAVAALVCLATAAAVLSP